MAFSLRLVQNTIEYVCIVSVVTVANVNLINILHFAACSSYSGSNLTGGITRVVSSHEQWRMKGGIGAIPPLSLRINYVLIRFRNIFCLSPSPRLSR